MEIILLIIFGILVIPYPLARLLRIKYKDPVRTWAYGYLYTLILFTIIIGVRFILGVIS